MFKHISGKALLVLVLDIHELVLCPRVIQVHLHFLELTQVRCPALADLVGDPVSQQAVSMKQETSLGDAVRLIVEFIRHHVVEIVKHVFLQDFRVQGGHAIYGMAADNRQERHTDLAIVNDGHSADHVGVIIVSGVDIVLEAAVDLLHDLVNTRQQAGEQVDRPFLKSFRHNRVVRVRAGAGCQIPGLVPAVSVLIHQETHELRYSNRRMGII